MKHVLTSCGHDSSSHFYISSFYAKHILLSFQDTLFMFTPANLTSIHKHQMFFSHNYIYISHFPFLSLIFSLPTYNVFLPISCCVPWRMSLRLSFSWVLFIFLGLRFWPQHFLSVKAPHLCASVSSLFISKNNKITSLLERQKTIIFPSASAMQ